MARAVIFDMDGVLVDSMPVHYQAWRIAFQPYGIEIPYELFVTTSGMTFEPVINLLSGGRSFTQEEMAGLVRRQKTTVEQSLAKHYPVFPGVPELLRTLDQEGWRLAVATSGPRANLELALRQIPEASRIKRAATLEDVRAGKPEPDVFLVAARRLRVLPYEAVVVEDSTAGLEAARRGGFPSLGVATTMPEEILAPLAGRTVTHMSDVTPALLAELLENKGGQAE